MSRLTPLEIKEIQRYLKEDRPLPEKYRFLLFENKREVELIWNGKNSNVCNVVLPFQIIEQIDEPRDNGETSLNPLFEVDNRGRQKEGWTNKLIWGDNKLILSSLKYGPMREEIERQGGIKLIYIDPPFDVGADFTMDIEIGDETFTKSPTIIEEIAYRDTWGNGTDSFISMIYERLSLMKDLLAEDGSIYVHCDWHVSNHIREILDELFFPQNFINEIIWHYPDKIPSGTKKLPQNHDTIYFYAKNKNKKIYNLLKVLRNEPIKLPRKLWNPELQKWRGYQRDSSGNIIYDIVNYKIEDDVWTIPAASVVRGKELLNYPTQKPSEILYRIIEMSSNKNDIIADFFCGSGTTPSVAEKLGRKWIATDIGKFAIHTTRKRLLGVQRELKKDGKTFRAFEIVNIGKYERQHYVAINLDLHEEEKIRQQEEKELAFQQLILNAYHTEPINGFKTFHGKKSGHMVVIGPINLPVTGLFIEEVILECRKYHVTNVDILGFEFEMGLFPHILDEAKKIGITISPKYIPIEVFDKRAVEKDQVAFHDVAYIEVRPHFNQNSVSIELTNYSIFYSEANRSDIESKLRPGSSKIFIDQGKIIKITKDKSGIIKQPEILTKKWSDWVDYWAVDFDFEMKREIVAVKDPTTDEIIEKWTGNFIFENEWQTFRTKKDRTLELKSIYHSYKGVTGRKKIAVKVVDILGNDTMRIIDINIESN
ncbi:MAG: site-specific DNA-methyltransferase [Deltaproteobacteria bacterium]|jgi:site-specific DNA-methyltransferase (adenine-specific)/adenine-specific DNA-methyltransferase|nr:site-specific DNA-methyltransferase [Deltaproteobacteria bacterium]